MKNHMEILRPHKTSDVRKHSAYVPAGFPSPADDYMADKIDLNTLLIKHTAATFLLKVAGDSMIEAGIFDGDYLIVDRSLTPTNGSIVVVVLDGLLTVKQLQVESHQIILMPANPAYKPIYLAKETELHVWGVVRHSIRKHV